MAEQKGPQWAMATPAEVYLVGVACIGIFGLLMGWVNPGAIPVVAVFLIACGIVTMALGTIELRRGDILLGSINICIWSGRIAQAIKFMSVMPHVGS